MNSKKMLIISCTFNGQKRAVIKETESFYFFAVGNRFKWNYAEKHLCNDLKFLWINAEA